MQGPPAPAARAAAMRRPACLAPRLAGLHHAPCKLHLHSLPLNPLQAPPESGTLSQVHWPEGAASHAGGCCAVLLHASREASNAAPSVSGAQPPRAARRRRRRAAAAVAAAAVARPHLPRWHPMLQACRRALRSCWRPAWRAPPVWRQPPPRTSAACGCLWRPPWRALTAPPPARGLACPRQATMTTQTSKCVRTCTVTGATTQVGGAEQAARAQGQPCGTGWKQLGPNSSTAARRPPFRRPPQRHLWVRGRLCGCLWRAAQHQGRLGLLLLLRAARRHRRRGL